MLAIFDSETREKMKKLWQGMREKEELSLKDGMVANLKRVTDKENIKRRIVKMIGEGNEVWVKERQTGIGSYENAEYDYEINNIFRLKNGKIIDFHWINDRSVLTF